MFSFCLTTETPLSEIIRQIEPVSKPEKKISYNHFIEITF